MSTIEEKLKAGAKVVDVRTTEEYEEENYPGAVNIPVDQLQARLSELEPKSAPLLLYCASGARSAWAARLLKASGWTDVTNAGGLDDMPQ